MKTSSRVVLLLRRKADYAIAVCLLQSKMDCCNNLLAGMQDQEVAGIQIAAARVVLRQKT